MISLIIVSHCHDIAVGVKQLAEQMTQDTTCIVAVGGIEDERGQIQLGTDAMRVNQVIRSHWSADGVLLLVDLGSAVLSAELAVEMLPPELQPHCLISNAPLVEGAIVAALEASLHRSLGDVNRAAEAVRMLDKVVR